ncbi:hypothetical protein [Actinoplanes sp. NPDC051851]|uniref:hypothetical protein n=1 Tax=Actinoplanes sp. NPDC051851 TaxID=3154753 RepID=UPI00342E3C10
MPRLTLLRDLATDRRITPLTAALGGVAAFASLVSEWQVTTVDGMAFGDDELDSSRMLPTDLVDLGGLGAAYLVGLLLLVTTVVLAVFGPLSGRVYARLCGYAVGGTLLAALLALVRLLGDQSRLVSRFYTVELTTEHLRVTYGRGVWCALAGVSLALAALWLAGRETEPVNEPRWRRGRSDDPLPESPLELTVTAVESRVNDGVTNR